MADFLASFSPLTQTWLLAELHLGAQRVCCLLFCCLFRGHQLELNAVFSWKERTLLRIFWEYCFLRILLLLCKCYFYLVKTRSSTFTEVVVGIWRKKILPRIFYPFLEVYGRCLESMCCSIRVISIYSLYPHFAMLLYSKKQNKSKTKKLVVFMRIISTSSTSSTPYRWWGCSEGPHCIVPFPYLLVGWIFFFWLFSFISLDTEGGRQLFFF